jgi:hypothetical protein
MSRAALTAFAAAAALAFLPGAAHADPNTAPGDGQVALGPTAKLSWRMADRYAGGWEAWQPTRGTYDRAYVHPGAWTVIFDGCGSLGHGQKLTRYEVEVKGAGFDYAKSAGGTACRITLFDLPRLGQYDVALTVRTEGGGSDRAEERITLRDHVIVSVGDSMASGEGTPDEPGSYKLLNDVDSEVDQLRFLAMLALGHPRPASNTDLKTREIKPVRWRDKRCHRSARSGHALTAQYLEDRDPHSSVTFIALACSGAEIKHLIDTEYSGQQPPANPQPAKLRPQLAVLRDLLSQDSAHIDPGSQTNARAAAVPVTRPVIASRRVDALLMSIGINDLDFSEIVKHCATNPATPHYGDPDCVTDGGVNGKIHELPAKYDALARALRTLNIAETYITDYPAAPFGREEGGCGMLGLRGVGIGTQEAHAMYLTGRSFNHWINDAANRNGWNFAEGMTNAFLGHDYCEPWGDRYLVRLEESLDGQGTEHGAVHPNRLGHTALRWVLGHAVALDRPAYPFIRTKVVIDQVKLGKSFHDPLKDFEVTVHRSAQETKSYVRGVQYMGQWRNVGLEFGVDVYDAPRPPRFATKLAFEIRPRNSAQGISVMHDARDTWGLGQHEVALPPSDGYPDGYMRVRYHVEVERVQDPDGPDRPVFQR